MTNKPLLRTWNSPTTVGCARLENFDNFAVRTATWPRIPCGDADHYAVPVHRVPGGISRNIDIAGDPFDRAIGNQEAITIPMHRKPAHREFAIAGGSHEMAGTGLDQCALSRQPRQHGLKLLPVGDAGAQFPYQLFEVSLGMRQTRDVFHEGRIGHILMVPMNDLAATVAAGLSSK